MLHFLHWCYTFCTGVTLFALVLHLNCTALSQSESSNFFMYIISSKNRKIVPYHGANPNTRNGARLRSPSPIMAPDWTEFLICWLNIIYISLWRGENWTQSSLAKLRNSAKCNSQVIFGRELPLAKLQRLEKYYFQYPKDVAYHNSSAKAALVTCSV